MNRGARCAVKDGVNVTVSLDPNPVIEAYKNDVDLALLRENLRLTPPNGFGR